MLKYVNYDVVFSEIPNETTLAINISNCPCHCKGCHSPYLAEDIGKPLTPKSLHELITLNKGVTCVAFMGGDASPGELNLLAQIVQAKGLLSAWYSGKQGLSLEIRLKNFNYIKLGPYIEELGGLKSPTTNQRLYKVKLNGGSNRESNPVCELEDITSEYWK